VPAAAAAGIQVIQRFTGGGTVVVDGDTLFASLILAAADVPGVEPFPQPIMRWTERLYASVFGRYGAFALRENDYVLGPRKFGGNAQAITRGRWLHHTSFLWDFDPARMALLAHPPRAPQYRAAREHGDFVTRLRDVAPHRPAVLADVAASLTKLGFDVRSASLEEAEAHLMLDHLRGNRLVDLAAAAAGGAAPAMAASRRDVTEGITW